MTTLSIVIPALNEEDGIATIVDRTLAVEPELAAQGLELELIVVDDGSTDRTAEIVQSYAPKVRLVQHEVNKGYGAAIKTGFQQATGEWLGFMDADGTYPPEAYPAMYEAALREEADLVIGSRMAGAESEMPLVRRIGNVFFAGLVSFVGKTYVSDSASGQRILRREALKKLYPLPDGLNFTPVMSTRALHEDMKAIEVPIIYHERAGRSKLNPITDGMRFLKTILWTGLSYNPVRLFSAVGLFFLAIAALVGVVLVLGRLSGATTFHPPGALALFVGVVSAVLGVSVYAFGATFNSLAALSRGERAASRIDRHFGWLGLTSIAVGLVIALLTVILNAANWDLGRVFFYLLGSAMFVVIGVQLIVSWVLMRVLEELSERARLAARDLGAEAAKPVVERAEAVFASAPANEAV